MENFKFYFVEILLPILQDQNSFGFSTKSSVEENKLIHDTTENLVICKVGYNLMYIAIVENFYAHLKLLPQNELDDIDHDLRRNGIFFEDLQNEVHSKEIINAFNYFFYSYGRFPSNLNLITVLNFFKNERCHVLL